MMSHPYNLLREAQEKHRKLTGEAEDVRQLPKGGLRRRASKFMHFLADRLEPVESYSFVYPRRKEFS